MARVSHLIRRGAAYSARMRVPLDLVEVIGKRELVRALGTSNESEAKRLLWPVIGGWQRMFDDLRARRELTPGDLEHATWDHYSATLERDESARAALPGETEIEAEKAKLTDRVERGEIEGFEPLTLMEAAIDLETMRRAGQFASKSRGVKLAEMRKHLAQASFPFCTKRRSASRCQAGRLADHARRSAKACFSVRASSFAAFCSSAAIASLLCKVPTRKEEWLAMVNRHRDRFLAIFAGRPEREHRHRIRTLLQTH